MHLLTLFLGIISWTLAEYLIHRFLGHELQIQTLFKKEHMEHHGNKDYFAPLWMKLIAATVIGSAMYFVIQFIIPTAYALSFTLSFILSFLSYEYFHYYVHIATPSTKIGLLLRKHHFYHHFENPKVNHGVTTRIWDRLFKTYLAPRQVSVHKNFAMDWLKQNQNEYEHDFIIKETTRFT